MIENNCKYYAQKFGYVKNSTGTKAVNISDQSVVSGFSNFYARYVQIYNGDEQVLEVKICSTFSAAERWAKRKLEIA